MYVSMKIYPLLHLDTHAHTRTQRSTYKTDTLPSYTHTPHTPYAHTYTFPGVPRWPTEVLGQQGNIEYSAKGEERGGGQSEGKERES